MKAFDDTLKCAFEQASNRDIACGKAMKEDYTKCKCGYHTHCAPKQKGNVWTCSDPKCAEKPRFERFEK